MTQQEMIIESAEKMELIENERRNKRRDRRSNIFLIIFALFLLLLTVSAIYVETKIKL